MSTITTVYQGDLRTQATHNASGSRIISEAPIDNHGKGEAFSPTDLLAASLGSCILTVAGIAAQTHRFSIEGARIETQKVMAENPRRVGELILDIYLPPNHYSDRERRIIEAAAATCPVGQSLNTNLKKTIRFHY
ncbi:MAG: OsmC family protein [Bacteroidetes bacterium]|nr:OsmC family protein [Bacteroidota bacterium]